MWNTQCDLAASPKEITSCLLSCFLRRHTPGLHDSVADRRRSLPGGSHLSGRRSRESQCVTSRLKSFPSSSTSLTAALSTFYFRMVSLLRTCMISLTPSLWAQRWFPAWLPCAQLWGASVRQCRSECKFSQLPTSRRWLWLWLQV